MLKKDQAKGFDFLSLEAFYNAIDFYGLPKTLTAFDRASQNQVPCRILIAFGLTEPIYINSVNWHGDNRAPIRFTLSTGMGSWYLQERATYHDMNSNPPMSIIIRPQNTVDRKPHTSTDNLSMCITSLEMIDDSILFSRSSDAITVL